MKKGLILCAVLSILVFVSGCMKADYNININKDGSGSVEMAVLYNNDVLSYVGDMEKPKTELTGKGFAVTDYKTEKQTGYKALKKVKNYAELKSLLNEMISGGATDEKQGFEIINEKGKLSITGSLDLTQGENAQMETYLKDVEVNINIKAPFKVLENNATKNEKGVYTWKLNLTGKNEVKMVMDTADYTIVILGLVGLVVLVGAGAFVMVFMNNKNKKDKVEGEIQDILDGENIEIVEGEEVVANEETENKEEVVEETTETVEEIKQPEAVVEAEEVKEEVIEEIKAEEIAEEVKVEETVEEVKAEEIVEEAKPEETVEEVVEAMPEETVEEVIEEVKTEEVAEEVKPEEDTETTETEAKEKK